MILLRRRKGDARPDPMVEVRGVAADLAERLAEVSEHLSLFSDGLAAMAETVREAEETTRKAGGRGGRGG